MIHKAYVVLARAAQDSLAWVSRRIAGVDEDSYEVQYLKLCRNVLRYGVMQANRTGIRALTLPGASMRFDVSKGAPVVTTKKLAVKSVLGELCGFLRASTSAADFRALGSKVWDQNANENKDWVANPWRDGHDHLGPVYGFAWRKWPAFKVVCIDDAVGQAREAAAMAIGYVRISVIEEMTDSGKSLKAVLSKKVDQLRDCLETLVKNPYDRRILFHGWNPATLDEQALPVCHLLYQLLPNVERKELSMCLFLRSNDLGLGNPFNALEGAAMLELVARLTGYTPKWLTLMIADAHLYETAIPMVKTQLKRTPKKPPRLVIGDRVPEFAKTGKFEPEWLDLVHPTDFSLEGYEHHPALTVAMAV